jgi:hypothetical protein
MMSRLFIALAALAAISLTVSGARADSLADQVKDASDTDLQAAAQAQAEQLRQLPAQLNEQNVPVTPAQVDQINKIADQAVAESQEPDFKDKVLKVMKSAEHGLKRIGIDTAKGLGYAGTAVFSASFTPIPFTGDLVMGSILGHGVFSKSDDNNLDTGLGMISGIASMWYLYVGLAAIGYTLEGPMVFSSMGVVITNWLICSHYDKQDGGELNQFCSNNIKLSKKILGSSARAGAFLGIHVHIGILDAWHFVEKPFKHAPPQTPPEAPTPNPAN